MRKLSLTVITTLLISSSCYAEPTLDLKQPIIDAFKNPNSLVYQQPLSMFYGGQDLSRPKIAIANESLWQGDAKIIV